MSVATDANLGTGKSSGAATTPLVTAAAVAAGAHIILIVGRFNGVNSTLSVAGGSLTWTEDVTVVNSSRRVSVFRAYAAAGLASGTTLTVTHTGGGTADCLVCGYSFTGIATSGTVVNTGSGFATATGWSSGNVAAGSGNALIGGAFADGLTGTSTPTAPGAELRDFNDAGQNETETMVWKSSVAGTDVIAGTWSGSVNHVAAAVAYLPASGSGQTIALGQATDTETAQAFGKLHTKALGQITDTEIAQAFAKLHTRALGQAAETDLSQAITAKAVRLLGRVSDTETALALTAVGGATVIVVVDNKLAVWIATIHS